MWWHAWHGNEIQREGKVMNLAMGGIEERIWKMGQ